MATFDHLCDPATSELCLQFAVAYGPWLALSGPIQESWLRLRRAIEIASPEPNITRAHALFWASNLAMYAGETESATALCQEAINVADHLNDPIAKAAAIHSRAWHEEMQENWETASQLFEQALVTWEETDNAFMQAQALMLLGGHAYVKDDLAVARSREEKAAALFEQTAGPDWRAGPHWYLGFIAVAEGRIADAAESYELSLNIWLESESPTPSCFKALVHLADIAVRVGLFEGAARMLGAAGKVMHDTGAVLFPFDEPASERAEEASCEALGVAQFYEYRDAGWRSSPDDWLREARVIVSAAQNTTENSGTSETASEWSLSHPASAKQGV
jgi:tetratricopeptide (TPR) repeat protein